MTATNEVGAAAKAVVHRAPEDVQSKGSLELFEELIADDFVDHTPSPRQTTNKAGVRALYRVLREAFPDFRAEIHWQTADGDMVTTYKTYHGTHRGWSLFGIPPTGREVQFGCVDVMRVRGGQIVEHWGVSNLCPCFTSWGPFLWRHRRRRIGLPRKYQ